MRLRLLRVLDSASGTFFRQPEKLKYLLCPVVAQGKAEQERFYELFDKYWEEISQPWEPPADLPEKPAFQIPGWWQWLLAAAMLAGLAAAVYFYLTDEVIEPCKANFVLASPQVHGDTLVFKNTSTSQDTAKTTYHWQLFDAGTGKLERQDTQSFDWKIIADAGVSERPEKIVRLVAHHLPKDWRDTFQIAFTINCSHPPKLDTILAKENAQKNKPVRFEAILPEQQDVTLEWKFDYDSMAQGRIVEYTFRRNGFFNVELTAIKNGETGFCQARKTHNITIGEDKAYLVAKPLWKDSVKPTVQFSWGTWILLGLLALAMIFYWVRWAARKPPLPPETSKPETLKPSNLQTEAPDKAPYFIPFRSQEPFIRVGRELFRLGDVLRMRQEGLRRELDVPGSVRATVAEGGFPNLKTALSTVPTEYLFLVDEQAAGSHQAEVFKFLVNLFKQREVLCEVFFYKTEMHRFWNDQHPDGISAEQLQRQFGFHRLIVLGDGHGLLDAGAGLRAAPGANGAPHFLKPAAVDFLKHWKRRLLLTPVPLASWTFREGALHELFAIFPAGTSGLVEATKFLERTLDEEDRPTFANWCERLAEEQTSAGFQTLPTLGLGAGDPDINYRTWRTAAGHRDYLENRPVSTSSADRSLYRWLCALAVYPKPEWSLTIAIGRAIGMETSYDNLLILSRIPWLQTGDLTQRLRKELLADLDPEGEKLARETVKQELEAVQPLVQGSHAGLLHQSQLAIQNFALDPADPVAQEAIRQLLEQNLLTPREINDLNGVVDGRRWTVDGGTPSTVNRQPSTIQEFLAENEPKPTPPQKPFFTKDFYRAAVATLAFLLIFLSTWMLGGTDRLHRWVFGEEPSASVANAEREMRDWFFVKESIFADSAVIYNNRGVDAYREVFGLNQLEGEMPVRKAVVFDWAAQERILSNFRRAIEGSKNKDYSLAESNMGKVYFNAARDKYNLYLQESPDTNFLHEATAHFLNASLVGFDSTRFDGMHGFGLAQFYLSRRDSAENAHQFLMENTGGQYFDTLSMFPHLDRLLFPEKYEGRRTISVRVLDAKTAKPVAGVLVTAANFQQATDRDGSFLVELREGERREFSFTHKSYRQMRQALSAEDGAVTLRMEPVDKAPIVSEPAPTKPSVFILNGLVKDKTSGKAIPFVAVDITRADGDADHGREETDERGRFSFKLDKLPGKPFPVNLVFTKEGYSTLSERVIVEEKEIGMVFEMILEEPKPLDRDGDGVPDAQDDCPEQPGDISLDGCPDIQKSHSWLEGKWSGEGTQSIPKWSKWDAVFEANLSNRSYKVDYPSIPCAGIWQLISVEKDKLTFKETLVEGRDNCQPGNVVEVFRKSQDTILFIYSEGTLLNYARATLTKQDEPVSYAKTARTPVFNGCENSNRKKEEKCTQEKIQSFIKQRLVYPKEAWAAQQEGTVQVSFIIEKNGSISQVECDGNGLPNYFCEEAILLMIQLPRFTPGQNGKGEAIRVLYKLPVSFTLRKGK